MDSFSRSADRPGVEGISSDQPVDECGLTDSRGAKKAIRLAWSKESLEILQSETRRVAEREDWGGDARALDLRDRLFPVLAERSSPSC